MSDSTEAIIDDLMRLGQLSLLFGRTMRSTFHEDGKRPESDTDHTVMLGLIAWAIAERYYPKLDIGLVTQFALVHDLVEAYAGDTPTLKITDSGIADKAIREKEALRRIENEFSVAFPGLPHMIEVYEARQAPEARFVKAVDKVIPKITHILNHGATLQDQGITRSEAIATYKRQGDDLQTYAADFPELLAIRHKLIDRMMAALVE